MKKSKKTFLTLLLAFLGLDFLGSYFFKPHNPNDMDRGDDPPVEIHLDKKKYQRDFDFVYKTLEDYYPFFEIEDRGDRLKNKDKYRDYLGESTSDEEFALRMDEILADLNGHTNIIGREELYQMYIGYYSLSNIYPQRDYIKIYQKPRVRARYQLNNANLERIKRSSPDLFSKSPKRGECLASSFVEPRAEVEDLVSGKIAYIKIPSMLDPESAPFEEDKKLIEAYLEKISTYQALILDIRGNGGGNSSYREDFLLPKIIDRDYETREYRFKKEGELTKKELDRYRYKKDVKSFLEKADFPERTKKIAGSFDRYRVFDKKIDPGKDSINFKGKIYLIVDGDVFSSAEALASFCKETGLASLVGERTGGDGLGIDPNQVALPYSGYVLRFPTTLGLTESGVINEEEKTLPDYLVDPSLIESLLDQASIKKVLDLEGLGEE